MYDVFGLPSGELNTQVFYDTSGAGGTGWKVWDKPRGVKFINIFMVGGGGGGAAGVAGASGTTRNGGGGGGSSAISKGLFQASLLPDVLYIFVGSGGTGGVSSGGNGQDGGLSYVSVQPNTTSANVLLASGAVAAKGAVGSAAGVAGTVFSQTGGLLSYFGVVSNVAGVNGAAGGTGGAVGGSITLALPVTGGAGGGGATTSSFSGGSIQGAGLIPTVSGGTAGTGNAGFDGYYSIRVGSDVNNQAPMFHTGGAGGGSNNAVGAPIGGAGGDGAYGCGGGGGGAGTTGGAGGNGGSGMVIITAW